MKKQSVTIQSIIIEYWFQNIPITNVEQYKRAKQIHTLFHTYRSDSILFRKLSVTLALKILDTPTQLTLANYPSAQVEPQNTLHHSQTTLPIPPTSTQVAPPKEEIPREESKLKQAISAVGSLILFLAFLWWFVAGQIAREGQAEFFGMIVITVVFWGIVFIIQAIQNSFLRSGYTIWMKQTSGQRPTVIIHKHTRARRAY